MIGVVNNIAFAEKKSSGKVPGDIIKKDFLTNKTILQIIYGKNISWGVFSHSAFAFLSIFS